MNNLLSHVMVLVLGLATGAFAYMTLHPVPQQSGQEPTYGAAAGPDVSFRTSFADNIIVGGGDFATSSIGTVTYTAASVANSRMIEHIAASAVTASLPTNTALSAIGFLPRVGDTQTVLIHASTTAVTLAGNTGVILLSASSTKAVAAGSIGRLECARLGATEARLIQCILVAD